MGAVHTEGTFESLIVGHLVENGWIEGHSQDFSKDLAMDKTAVLSFVQESQPREWEKLKTYHGDDTGNKLIYRLFRELEMRGMLDVIRHGIIDSGIKFKLAYFKPASKLNPETQKQYAYNRFYVTRQVYYSSQNKKSIDLLLSLNGLPMATMELKNIFTGQSVKEAGVQYRTSRDPRELLFFFNKRALVHFAVDQDQIFFTTKIEKDKTHFFPFNKGYNQGPGNPPAKDYSACRTSYLWEEILQVDNWMEIIGLFMHLQKEDYVEEGRKYTRKTILFPRYHQLEVVKKLTAHARETGPGQRYLIQHSAGSGKSNSIAWLAYRLSSLYNQEDHKVFDTVIVITDRRVLDGQLQDTIYQFEHKSGMIQRIDKDSKQLAEAITAGGGIIITTLQKFPYALDHLAQVSDRNYAVIIDEAHSSQGGEASRKMNEALAGMNVSLDQAQQTESNIEENTLDEEDFIREVIKKRGPQRNISLFAFTATPKPKTLEVFGSKDADNRPRPFHLYSMRQAIEEGFILDVLKNYTTYKTYYQFCKTITDDPRLNKSKAQKAIGRFASLHPTNIAQKTQIMVEHFKNVTMEKIGGKGKAMVVTESRKHALRYYLEFKDYIKEKGYENIRPLVAFSGTVVDDRYPEGITEPQLNDFKENELPDKFNTDEYQVLLVADKYQYGFDQPLLHTMYVDKKLNGVKAVQTLSRLNRIYPGKEEAFVLDFANDRQTIIDSFQPYYEMTTMNEATDPNHLYDLKNKTDDAQVYYQSEVNSFAHIFYRKGNVSPQNLGKLYGYVDPSVDRYKMMAEEQQDEFKKSLNAFVHIYSYLSMIIPFQDVELEKLYTFGRFLLTKLPKVDYTDRLKLDNEVALEYYRVQKIAEADLVLQIMEEYNLEPVTEAGISRPKDEQDTLSNIIKFLNEKYNTDFTEADRLYFEQIEQVLYENEDLKLRALNNQIDNFKFAFNDVFFQTLIDRMEANQEIFEKIMVDSDFQEVVKDWLTRKIYKRFNQEKTQK